MKIKVKSIESIKDWYKIFLDIESVNKIRNINNKLNIN